MRFANFAVHAVRRNVVAALNGHGWKWNSIPRRMPPHRALAASAVRRLSFLQITSDVGHSHSQYWQQGWAGSRLKRYSLNMSDGAIQRVGVCPFTVPVGNKTPAFPRTTPSAAEVRNERAPQHETTWHDLRDDRSEFNPGRTRYRLQAQQADRTAMTCHAPVYALRHDTRAFPLPAQYDISSPRPLEFPGFSKFSRWVVILC